MAFGARVLTCPNCGGTLRWTGSVEVIECRYCQAHVAVDTGGRTDRPTQTVSVLVPVPRRTMGVGVAVVGLVVLGAGGAMAMRQRLRAPRATTAPAVTSTVAELLATPLAATAAEVAARHRVTAHGGRVVIQLADPTFASVDLEWDPAHPDHVSGAVIRPRASAGELTEVIARARTLLGRRLRPGSGGSYQFATLANTFYLGDTLQVRANDLARPGWPAQLEALWAVLGHAAFAAPVTLDDAARRDLLDLGYPLARVAQLDPELGVDDAAAAVRALAPNAVTSGADHRLQLDHPYFESATLSWANAAGGRWRSLTLYYPVELELAAIADPLIACLAPVVGQPARLVDDHLAGTFWLQYPARGGRPWINVSKQVLAVLPHYDFGEPVTADGLAAVLAALARCGGADGAAPPTAPATNPP